MSRLYRLDTRLAVIACAAALTACGGAAAPSGIATDPGVAAGGTSSPTAQLGVRTVLAPLGLNIHAGPQLTAAVVGTVAEGVTLTLLDHTDQAGGWFKVQGQTVTGWVVADGTLTAAGQFTPYQSTQRGFSALYPQGWTFAEEPADVLFHPADGPETIVVRTAEHVADFGPVGAAGFVAAGSRAVVVCGVTTSLEEFRRSGGTATTPTPGTAGSLALLEQFRFPLDATHAMALDYNHLTAADSAAFDSFYNSMTFPFPQCQAPAPSPSTSPMPT